MRLRFLGTGTSFGIPVIGCSCRACTSTDPRDRRTRHGALLQSDNGDTTILIDTPPELRLQLLDAAVSHLDAVWYTHAHADHTHGIDDLRVFSHDATGPMPTYADSSCAAFLRDKFEYIFDEQFQPISGPKVNLDLKTFHDREALQIGSLSMLPLAFPHGDTDTYGFRAGNLGYVTDAKRVPPEARAALKGVTVLVLSALWFGHPHPTHMNIEEAIAVAQDIGARQTFLTHLTHRIVHKDAEARLPEGISLAYDGLVVEI